MSVKVQLSGPLFDGTAEKALDDIADGATLEVAQEAFKRVRARLRSVLKNPTGYYESRVQVSNTSNGNTVDDGGVIYGPWLEGVGSRNSSTRFKGYNTFRLVSQEMEKQAVIVTDRAVTENIGRLQ
jgi:hypothetical protein